MMDLLLCPAQKCHKPEDAAVMITGTSRGLGREQALRFIEKGFTVFGTVRTEKDKEKWLSEQGGQVIPIIMDTAFPEQVDAAIAEVKGYLVSKKLKL